jgi:hypothetical protein
LADRGQKILELINGGHEVFNKKTAERILAFSIGGQTFRSLLFYYFGAISVFAVQTSHVPEEEVRHTMEHYCQ